MSNVVLEELFERDLPAIQAVFDACEDYFVITTGGPAPTTAADLLLRQLPAGCHYEDKHVLGICDARSCELVGLIDAIAGYPDLRTLTVGLFLLVPEHLSSGVAQEAHALLERWARRRGASRIRIANWQGLQATAGFLEQIGFRARREQIRGGVREVLVFEKRLFGDRASRS
jgi:RimJ/RimL family protein N-acetyltransferase